MAAANPFNTLTLSILLGSKSKDLLAPLFPLEKPATPPTALVSLLKGTPSTIKRAWLLPSTDVVLRIMTFVPEPARPLVCVIWTPDALPKRALVTSCSGLSCISSESTVEIA